MRTQEDVATFAMEFEGHYGMCFAFWINQSRSPLLKGNNFVFDIFIRDMFSYTELTEVDMTNVTITLNYSDLTKVTSGHVLITIIGIHFVP